MKSNDKLSHCCCALFVVIFILCELEKCKYFMSWKKIYLAISGRLGFGWDSALPANWVLWNCIVAKFRVCFCYCFANSGFAVRIWSEFFGCKSYLHALHFLKVALLAKSAKKLQKCKEMGMEYKKLQKAKKK